MKAGIDKQKHKSISIFNFQFLISIEFLMKQFKEKSPQ